MLDFRGPVTGSLKSAFTTSYRSSIDSIALNCLVFFYRKSLFFAIWRQTDRQTNRQTNKWTSPLHIAAFDVASGGLIITSVSEAIRKPPLVKAQTALKLNKYGEKRFSNMADEILTPCNVACCSGIMTENSSSGSTLQCDRWLWDEMSFIEFAQTSPILELYIWLRFRPYHCS